MRRLPPAFRTGLPAAAALVLLTGCGGSDDGSDSSASDTPTTASETSASETTAAENTSEFCTQAGQVQDRVESTFSGASDPAALSQAFQEAATQIRAIDPPEEIASDWASFADGIDAIATAAQVDLNDPAAAATFQQQAAQVQQQYGTAFTNVEKYLADECGFTDSATETSAPTS